MARYIDADKYKADLLTGQEYLDEDTLLTATNLLDCQPTADVVGKSLFYELKNTLQKVKITSEDRQAEYGAKYALEQIIYLVDKFIEIKVDGKE